MASNFTFGVRTGLWMLAMTVWSLAKGYGQGRLLFQHLSINEGLPNNTIHCITDDAYGMTWIATDNGIARFDGKTMDVFRAGDPNSYGPAGGNVDFIGTIPGNPAVWVGASTGLSRFDPQTGRWYRVPILYDEQGAPLPTYVYPFHIDDKGDVWIYVGYFGSICRYHPRRGVVEPITRNADGKTYTPDSLYRPLRTSASVLPRGIGFNRYKAAGLSEEKKYFGGNHSFSFTMYRAYYPHENELWLATDKGLLCYNPLKDTHVVYEFPSGVSAAVPDRLAPQYLWIGTHNHGVYRFNRQTRMADLHVEHDPEDPYSLRSNQVRFLYADTLGRLWVALTGKGLAYADLETHPFVADFSGPSVKQQGLSNTITHLFATQHGTYLAGTMGSGLLEFSSDGKWLGSVWGGSGSSIFGGITDENGCLFQANEGYFFYNEHTRRTTPLLTDGTRNWIVYHWLPYGKQLYAATDSGLFQVERQRSCIRFTPQKRVNRALSYDNIQYAAIYDGWLYIKTHYTFFSVFRMADTGIVPIKNLQNQNYRINDMLFTDTHARFSLVATSAGIKLWDVLAQDWVANHPYRLDENVQSLTYLAGSGLWAATDNGLFRYDAEFKHFERFGQENGLPSEQFTPAKLNLPGQVVWGTVNGAVRMPTGFTADTLRKPLWLAKSAQVGNEKVRGFWPGHFPDTLLVPSGASGFALQVALMGTSPNNGGHLAYRLTGVDSSFHRVEGNSVQLNYDRLSPGEYRLELEFHEKWPRRQVWKKQVLVTVEPAFYQTAGFRVLVIVCALLLLAAVVRLLLLRQKRMDKRRLRMIVESQEKERARIAADLHDDLGGKLSTLKLLLEETGRQTPSLKSLKIYTGSLDMLDHSINDLRTSIYSLNPRALADAGVFVTLEHLCTRISLSGGPTVKMELNETLKARRFPPETETVIYRLVQELLNNTLKHADAKNIHLSFTLRDDVRLSISYTDNGKGFDEDSIQKGLGLQNIRTRVHVMDGEIQFRSAPGHGVKVAIFIPVTSITAP